MPSSSARYSTLIRPDRRLRQCVLLLGVILALTGAGIVIQLPVKPLFRVLLLVFWAWLSACELWRTRRAYRGRRVYRLYSDGAVDVIDRDGGTRPGVYAAGSVPGRRLAWLCVREAGGTRRGELVAGNARKNNDWRRFQVICRHLAAC